MAKMLDLALDAENIQSSWRLFSNDKGLWSQRMPVERMASEVFFHLSTLVEEVRDGKYTPEVMHCFEIDKADGKKRLICASNVRDKILQRAVMNVLEPLAERLFFDYSYGYRKLRTVDMALSKIRELVIQGWIWLGDADIKKCFDNIPHYPCLKQLQSLCKDKQLVSLVHLWLESMPLDYRQPNKGLPQGMVLSPLMCNLYLHQLDAVLVKKRIPYVRFADDFVVFGRNEPEAKKALMVATETLHKLSLNLNFEKTRVILSSPKYRFLGKRFPDAKRRAQKA